MRRLALLTLPFLFAAGQAAAQNSFNNQTGNAQNASRMSGLHTDKSQVHQMDTNAANSYSGPGQAGIPLTTATSPPSQNGAMPLAGAAAPASGANGGTNSGMTPGSGGNAPR